MGKDEELKELKAVKEQMQAIKNDLGKKDEELKELKAVKEQMQAAEEVIDNLQKQAVEGGPKIIDLQSKVSALESHDKDQAITALESRVSALESHEIIALESRVIALEDDYKNQAAVQLANQ